MEEIAPGLTNGAHPPDMTPSGTGRFSSGLLLPVLSSLARGNPVPETRARQKDPVIVVLQLTGGNDYLNTVIPYNNPLYRDNRKAVGIPDNQIMHLDKDYGIPHYMAPLKQFWD